MSCKLWVCEARCCYEGWGCGPAINDSIRSSSNNDNRNNTDSPTLLTARAEGARGERETQFLETDWENITFLELCLLLLLLSLHLTIILFTATSTLTLIHHHHPPSLSLSLCYIHTDGTHQSAFGFDKWSVLAVHLVVEPAGVAQVVSGAVTSPQRRWGGSTVYTLTALWWKTHSDIHQTSYPVQISR